MTSVIERRMTGIHRLPVMDRGNQGILNARLLHELHERRFVRRHEPFEFESTLPPVIGYVPLAERKAFTTFLPSYRGEFAALNSDLEEERKLVHDLHERLPQTMAMIKYDMEQLGAPLVRLSDVEIERKNAKFATRAPFWHIDSLAYLVSDIGTQFYQGKAKAEFIDEDYFELDTGSYDDLPLIVQAPSFAIVRKGPWVAHKSPEMDGKGERTFFIAQTEFL